MISELEQVAYHEAGHAVVCVALGGKCRSVTIVPTDKYLGLARNNHPWRCEEKIGVILGGATAEWEYGWRRGEKLNEHCYLDLERADELLDQWYHGEAPPRLECDEYIEGEELALQTVSDYWTCIESVANYLMRHNTISGRLIHGLVAQHRSRVEQRKVQNVKRLQTH